MTRWRWIVGFGLGLSGGLAIASLGYINDRVLHLNMLVGNHLPISVFGLLLLVVILINPLLRLISPRIQLTSGQLGLAVMMMLVACSVPGGGTLRTLTPSLSLPWVHYDRQPAWQATHVMDRYLPPDMLVPPDPDVLDPLQSGFAASGEPIPPTHMFSDSRIPWAKWARPLRFWLPIVLLVNLGVICMSLLVHPQWSHREHLRYPIAAFATTLMGPDQSGHRPAILRSRLFWLGLGSVLTIHIINGTHAWYPDFVQITRLHDLWQIPQHYDYFRRLGFCSSGVWWVRIYPSVIAFSFFLASDVALALGLSQILPVLILPALVLNDVEISGGWLDGGTVQWQVIGSYLAMGMTLVYIGRRYYWGALRSAVTFRSVSGVERYATWAMRGLLLCMVGLVCLLTFGFGLPWPFSLLTVLILWLIFLVLARLNAEAGLFFLEAAWFPLTFLSGLFGAYALGPKAYLIIGFMSIVLVMDPRECLMPFLVTGLRIAEQTGTRPARAGWLAPMVFVLATAVALPIVIWSHYNYGVAPRDPWSTTYVPPQPFQETAQRIRQLDNEGLLSQSEGLSTAQRLAGPLGQHNPRRGAFLWAIGIGVALVLATSLLRLRFAWWPLHPIIFIVWPTYSLLMFAASFLLGWIVRTAVRRLGGQPAYRVGRDFMVGVVAGDLLGGLLFMCIGGVYYVVTGVNPPEFMVFPG